jgi:hypothetical protein
MCRWLIILLRILFPLDPVAQLGHVTRYFIGTIIDSFNDPDWMEHLATIDEARAILEAKTASAEEGLQLLIHERACQLLGHPYWYVRRPLEYPRRRTRPTPCCADAARSRSQPARPHRSYKDDPRSP